LKKKNIQYLLWVNQRQFKKRKIEIHKSKAKRRNKFIKKREPVHKEYRKSIKNERKQISIKLHSDYSYISGNKKIDIDSQFGLEDSKQFDNYLSYASSIIDFNERELTLNLNNCARVWPSAVTLMCSLKEWVEFGSKYNHIKHPLIRSTDSKDSSVNSYLTHCGFYDYVGRIANNNSGEFNDSHIVKIQRELKKDSDTMCQKEDSIIKLLENTTTFTKSQIKLFCSTVILEVFQNVIEHGITCNDQGWWVLAQYHPLHHFISINIADNGIGFKNSLLSGPQSQQLKDELGTNAEDEGYLLQYAMNENVSGAIDASIKEGYFFHKGYKKGSGRGNGLDRIRTTCKELGVPFSILSHYGYISYNNRGSVIKSGSCKNRIFAGTLYHFNFPIKEA
jgi:hypothetical protein